MHHYRLGVACVASEIVLSGLPEARSGSSVDIRIRRGAPDDGPIDWRDHPQGAETTPAWAQVDYFRSADGRWYRIRYDYRGHVADFAIRDDGRTITVETTEGETDAELSNLIEGPILGRAMRLAGLPCIHGTALASDGRAIVLMGGSGVGKSSLAWALVQQGCGLVTDDIVGIEQGPGGLLVHPGRARLRMWPDTARRLGLGATADVLFPTATEMEKVSVRDHSSFEDSPVPLHAVYRLLPRDATLEAPGIEEMPWGERLAELGANLHGVLAPDREGRRRELSMLAAVAAGAPVRSLTLPDDLEALPRMAGSLRQRLFR
ncbi:MAG: hypothetical protein Q8J89_01065 [Caulobacter sp.]|nr:hypothetical protein [Caulobacter sp.]